MQHKRAKLCVFKILPLIFLLYFCPNRLEAQDQKVEIKGDLIESNRVTIELKNGSILMGLIKEKNREEIELDLGDGNFITITYECIDKIYYNLNKFNNANKFYDNRTTPIKNQFYHISQGGILINTIPNAPQTWSLSFINGFQFAPQFSIGLGINIEKIDLHLFTPIFIEIRGDLLGKHKISPQYFAGVGNGYLINKDDNEDNGYSEKGGLFYEYGLGLKIKISDKIAYLLSISSQSQMYEDLLYFESTSVTVGDWWQETELEYRRINVKMGINF